MKWCGVQLESVQGDIARNVKRHLSAIQGACDAGVDVIVFPELSLTGYDLNIAPRFATHPDDERLQPLQDYADKLSVTVAAGLPVKTDGGVLISLVIFQPKARRSYYAKRYLHDDELPYFIAGDQDGLLLCDKAALAICYETSVDAHIQHAAKLGASLYLASVVKNAKGMQQAKKRLPDIARQYHMPIMLVNNVGVGDGGVSAGQSCVWNADGELIIGLDDTQQALLIYCDQTGQASSIEHH